MLTIGHHFRPCSGCDVPIGPVKYEILSNQPMFPSVYFLLACYIFARTRMPDLLPGLSLKSPKGNSAWRKRLRLSMHQNSMGVSMTRFGNQQNPASLFVNASHTKARQQRKRQRYAFSMRGLLSTLAFIATTLNLHELPRRNCAATHIKTWTITPKFPRNPRDPVRCEVYLFILAGAPTISRIGETDRF